MYLRAHHILCFLGFRGFGYSDEFVENFRSVYNRVLSKNEEVILVSCPDDICQKCPELKDGVCLSDEKVRRYDEKVLSFFSKRMDIKKEISPDILYNELIHMNVDEFEDICKDCSWYLLGYCYEGFLKLKKRGV